MHAAVENGYFWLFTCQGAIAKAMVQDKCKNVAICQNFQKNWNFG